MSRHTSVKFGKFWLDKIAKTLCLSGFCATSQRILHLP
jgi:hypothetical protein